MEDTQCSFRPGRSTTDKIFEKCWEYAKHVYAYIVDLDKA